MVRPFVADGICYGMGSIRRRSYNLIRHFLAHFLTPSKSLRCHQEPFSKNHQLIVAHLRFGQNCLGQSSANLGLFNLCQRISICLPHSYALSPTHKRAHTHATRTQTHKHTDTRTHTHYSHTNTHALSLTNKI